MSDKNTIASWLRDPHTYADTTAEPPPGWQAGVLDRLKLPLELERVAPPAAKPIWKSKRIVLPLAGVVSLLVVTASVNSDLPLTQIANRTEFWIAYALVVSFGTLAWKTCRHGCRFR